MNMKTLTDESIALLREMIAIPSPSFHEERVCGCISSFLSERGIAHSMLFNNIIAVSRGYSPEKKTLMLCAHTDTVQACSGYDFDPYSPDTAEAAAALGLPEDGLIPGLGSNDDGASAVSMIAAFRHFYDKDLQFNLMLVLSAEEERSGANGMDAVMKALADGRLRAENGPVIRKPDYAIVGEPTGMLAAVAERGLLVIDAEARGTSGHAARSEGVNAIYKAMEDIGKLRAFRFGKISPLMGEVRLSVTQIEAGTAHNVIPDSCRFVVDIRPTERYCNAEIMEMLQAECASVLTARNLANRSSATFPDSPLAACAESLGIGTFVSPTTSDWMRLDCDAVKMGPGDSSRSHRKNEYATESEIRDAVEIYVKFIESYGNTLEQRN